VIGTTVPTIVQGRGGTIADRDLGFATRARGFQRAKSRNLDGRALLLRRSPTMGSPKRGLRPREPQGPTFQLHGTAAWRAAWRFGSNGGRGGRTGGDSITWELSFRFPRHSSIRSKNCSADYYQIPLRISALLVRIEESNTSASEADLVVGARRTFGPVSPLICPVARIGNLHEKMRRGWPESRTIKLLPPICQCFCLWGWTAIFNTSGQLEGEILEKVRTLAEPLFPS